MLFSDLGIEEVVAGLDKVAKNELQETIDSLVQRIHALEKTVTENIGILLAYDARICIEVMLHNNSAGLIDAGGNDQDV